MADINKDNVLSLLYSDLEKLNPPTEIVNYLSQLVSTSVVEISREGINLATETVIPETGDSYQQYTIDSAQTIEMYAAYLYRKRTDGTGAMPRMLRFRLNNLLFSQKGAIDVI
ncbi:MAG: hypothetical protein WCS21_05500 [Lachnospiraceae bacterium]